MDLIVSVLAPRGRLDEDEPGTPRTSMPVIGQLRRKRASPHVVADMLDRADDPNSLFNEMRDAARTIAKYVRRRRWLHLVNTMKTPLVVHAPISGVRMHCIYLLDVHAHTWDQQGAMRLDGLIGPSHRMYTGRSFGCMPPSSTTRFVFIGLVESRRFEWSVLLAIGVNCLLLAVDPHTVTPLAATIDYALVVCFTIEVLCRMIAMGACRSTAPRLSIQQALAPCRRDVTTASVALLCAGVWFESGDTYLSSRWRAMDFGLVCLGWLPIVAPQA